MGKIFYIYKKTKKDRKRCDLPQVTFFTLDDKASTLLALTLL